MTAGLEENPGEAQARRLESVYIQLAALLRQPEVAQRLRAAPLRVHARRPGTPRRCRARRGVTFQSIMPAR